MGNLKTQNKTINCFDLDTGKVQNQLKKVNMNFVSLYHIMVLI